MRSRRTTITLIRIRPVWLCVCTHLLPGWYPGVAVSWKGHGNARIFPIAGVVFIGASYILKLAEFVNDSEYRIAVIQNLWPESDRRVSERICPPMRRSSDDLLITHVRSKDLRYRYRSVFILVIFQYGDHRSRQRKTGTVQRVYEFTLEMRFGSELDPRSARLEICET